MVVYIMGQFNTGYEEFEKKKDDLSKSIEAKMKEVGKYIKNHGGDALGTEEEIVEQV